MIKKVSLVLFVGNVIIWGILQNWGACLGWIVATALQIEIIAKNSN